MYEEEDNNLSWHYRRVSAYFYTNPDLCNDGLPTYLTHQNAMESAIDHAFAIAYRHHPNMAQLTHSRQYPPDTSPTMNRSNEAVYWNRQHSSATLSQPFQRPLANRVNLTGISQHRLRSGTHLSTGRYPTPQISPVPDPDCTSALSRSRSLNHPSFPAGSLSHIGKSSQLEPVTNSPNAYINEATTRAGPLQRQPPLYSKSAPVYYDMKPQVTSIHPPTYPLVDSEIEHRSSGDNPSASGSGSTDAGVAKSPINAPRYPGDTWATFIDIDQLEAENC